MHKISVVLGTILFAAANVWATIGVAHEVPDQVTVLSFLKPEGNTLTVLLRVPMSSLRDIDIPLTDNGFLDLSQAERAVQEGAQVWVRDFIRIYENGALLPEPRFVGARVSLLSDRSFASFDQALAHITGEPLPAETQIYWEQGLADIAYEYPIQSDDSRFAIDPGLTRLGLEVNIGLTFLSPGGVERVFDVHPEVGVVELDPSWLQAFYFFAKEGFFHILDGIDHLLFLLALVIPFRRFRPLVVVATAFTVGHSITLIASAFGLAPNTLWFPYLVETLIAVSILYMAIENIVGANADRRWWLAFGFGMVHGFGFSFLLGERLQFAGSHLITSLLAFNVGVEIGQILVLAIAVPALALLFRYVLPERIGIIILSAFVAHTAWDWTLERGSNLSRFSWPTPQALLASGALWWVAAILALIALLWWVSELVPRLNASGERSASPTRKR